MKRFVQVVLGGMCTVADSPADGKEIESVFDGGMLSCEGGKMIVALDANATTGYEWKSSIEGAAVKAAGDEYEADTTSDGKAGAGGVHTFTYQAEGSGEATVTLTYARSWEASDSDRTAVVNVEVKDGVFVEASVR